MVRKIIKTVVYSILLALPLVVVGLIVAVSVTGYPESVHMNLFVLGAVLIVLFLPGLFSSSTSGALHTSNVFFRKVGTLDRKKAGESKGSSISPLNLVLAGLLTWLAGYLL